MKIKTPYEKYLILSFSQWGILFALMCNLSPSSPKISATNPTGQTQPQKGLGIIIVEAVADAPRIMPASQKIRVPLRSESNGLSKNAMGQMACTQ